MSVKSGKTNLLSFVKEQDRTFDGYGTYYDLIEYNDGKNVLHIPVPIFVKSLKNNRKFKIKLSEKIRDGKFYKCPICKKYSFYKCSEMSHLLQIIDSFDENHFLHEAYSEEQREKAKKLLQREQKKKQLKEEILSNPRKYMKNLSYIRAINPIKCETCGDLCYYNEYDFIPRFNSCQKCGAWICDVGCSFLVNGKIFCIKCKEEQESEKK